MAEKCVKNKNTILIKRIILEKYYNATVQPYTAFAIVIATFAILALIISPYDRCNNCFSTVQNLEDVITNYTKFTKRYWAFGRNIKSGYLHNVFHSLDRLGYIYDENGTNWDLLWAHDYPFRSLESALIKLKLHQKVNKFPGSGFITNKVDLATSGLEYIPSAFRLPKDKKKLLEYSKKNPKIQFVQKHNEHRNIFIKKIEEINLDVEGTFVQEFIDNPLLVDDHKFDIGIYAIITSVDPLRVYIYNGDALLRFCPVKYHPFDPNNLDKYVVGDDYLPTWEIPSLNYYYNNLGFGMKESLNAYIRSVNKNPDLIWEQIEQIIRNVFINKETYLIKAASKYQTTVNFFEMMRFDFIVNKNLTVYLMEANMSPNLSSAHFPPNKLLFEQVIFNLLGLVGVSERVKNDANYLPHIREGMLVEDKNLAVFPTECGSPICRASCVSPNCQLCRPCLSERTKNNLKRAYLEHINRGACKRIFPPSIVPNSNEAVELLSLENQIQYKWFQGKCKLDSSWCF